MTTLIEECHMRALLLCLLGLATASPALAQMKLPTKTAPGASEVRYFTAIDGLMDGNADVVLKETRQGKTVTAATLDVCYPAAKGSERKDRFVANLTVSGQTLTGTTQSMGDKQPVAIKLTRKPTGDTFEFRGQITIGQAVTEVTSKRNFWRTRPPTTASRRRRRNSPTSRRRRSACGSSSMRRLNS
jgi:hypothetical protein